MSFLAGRLAATEGSYFLQESKQAVGRLVHKNKASNPSPTAIQSESAADVLPEILKHSLPSKILKPPPAGSSLTRASKWALQPDSSNVSTVSPDALNPLRAYVSLPQVTFGPKRWQLPNSESAVLASTANELRRDKHTPVNPEKLKAAAVGLSQIAKAFAAATALVFGGATVTFGLAASQLDVHNTDDIRIKGRDFVQPRFETIREQVIPLRAWAEGVSKKWHMERKQDIKEKPLVKELSKMLATRTTN